MKTIIRALLGASLVVAPAADRVDAQSSGQLPPALQKALDEELKADKPADDLELEYDKDTDFSRYRTFSWAPFLEPVTNVDENRVIMVAIEEAVIARGLVKATTERPDMFVNYWLRLEKKVKTTSNPATSPFEPAAQSVIVNVEKAEDATLGVELYDALGNRLVWRTKVQGAVESRPMAREQLDRALTRMLAKYPPPKP